MKCLSIAGTGLNCTTLPAGINFFGTKYFFMAKNFAAIAYSDEVKKMQEKTG